MPGRARFRPGRLPGLILPSAAAILAAVHGKRIAGRSLCLLLLSACVPTASLHTARPVPVGTTQVGVALGAYVFEDDGDLDGLPVLEAQVRHGFHPHVDIGVQATSLATYALDVNVALVLTDSFALSVDPTVAVSPIGVGLVSYFWLPVLADVVSTPDFTLTLALRPGYVHVDDVGLEDLDFGIDASASLLGAGIAARIRLTDRLSLVPEVSATWLSESAADEGIYAVSLGLVW